MFYRKVNKQLEGKIRNLELDYGLRNEIEELGIKCPLVYLLVYAYRQPPLFRIFVAVFPAFDPLNSLCLFPYDKIKSSKVAFCEYCLCTLALQHVLPILLSFNISNDMRKSLSSVYLQRNV